MEPNSNLFNRLFPHLSPSEQDLSQTRNLYSGVRQDGAGLPARWDQADPHSNWYGAQGEPIVPVELRLPTSARTDRSVDVTGYHDRPVPSHPAPQRDPHQGQLHTPAWPYRDTSMHRPLAEHHHGDGRPGVQTNTWRPRPLAPFAAFEGWASPNPPADETDHGPESLSPKSLKLVQELLGTPVEGDGSSSSTKKRKGVPGFGVETLRMPPRANPIPAQPRGTIAASGGHFDEPTWYQHVTQSLEGKVPEQVLSLLGLEYFRAPHPTRTSRKINLLPPNEKQMALVRKIVELRLQPDLDRTVLERGYNFRNFALDVHWGEPPQQLTTRYVHSFRPKALPSGPHLDLEPLKVDDSFRLGDYVVALKANKGSFAISPAKRCLEHVNETFHFTVVAWPTRGPKVDKDGDPIVVGELNVRAAGAGTESPSASIIIASESARQAWSHP